MAGTMPHAIFIETDVDGSGLVGAYAAELPGCAVFAATDDEAAVRHAAPGEPIHRLAARRRRGAARLRRRQLVRGRARARRRWRTSARRLHPRRAAADRRGVRDLAALAGAGARGACRRAGRRAILRPSPTCSTRSSARTSPSSATWAAERRSWRATRSTASTLARDALTDALEAAGPSPRRRAPHAPARDRRRPAGGRGARGRRGDRPRERVAEAAPTRRRLAESRRRAALRPEPSCGGSRTPCRACADGSCAGAVGRRDGARDADRPGARAGARSRPACPSPGTPGKRLGGWLGAAGIGVRRLPGALVRDQRREVLPGAGSGLIGRSRRRRAPRSRAGRRSCSRRFASSRPPWCCWSAGWRIGSRSGRPRGSTTSSGASCRGMRRAGASVLCLPHPSGASTWLNDPARVELWRRGLTLLRDRWAELEHDPGGPARGPRRRRRWARSWSCMLVVGSLGGPRPEVDPLTVEEVLALARRTDGGATSSTSPAGTPSSTPTAPATTAAPIPSVAWLQRDCPLRVLLPAQPAPDVTPGGAAARRAAARGARRAAPSRRAPSRRGPNLRGPAARLRRPLRRSGGGVVRARAVDRCRSTLVVSDYDELVR